MNQPTKSKFKVTITNQLSTEAIQDFTKQMLKIYNELTTKETKQQEAA